MKIYLTKRSISLAAESHEERDQLTRVRARVQDLGMSFRSESELAGRVLSLAVIYVPSHREIDPYPNWIELEPEPEPAPERMPCTR